MKDPIGHMLVTNYTGIVSSGFSAISSNNVDVQIAGLDGLFSFLTSVFESNGQLFLSDTNIAERCVDLATTHLSFPNADVNRKICKFFEELLKSGQKYGQAFESLLKYMSPKLIDSTLKVCHFEYLLISS